MNNLYKTALISGLLSLSLLATLLILWLSFQPDWLNGITLPVIVFSAMLILAGFTANTKFYKKAKSQRSQRNMSKSLVPFAILIFNLPLAVVTYSTTQYVEATHTVTIVNNSNKTIKKLFFSNGNDKYFVKPIEPGEQYVKALLFKNNGKVTYTFNLDKEVFSGVLFKNIIVGQGASSSLKVNQLEKVRVEEL